MKSEIEVIWGIEFPKRAIGLNVLISRLFRLIWDRVPDGRVEGRKEPFTPPHDDFSLFPLFILTNLSSSICHSVKHSQSVKEVSRSLQSA